MRPRAFFCIAAGALCFLRLMYASEMIVMWLFLMFAAAFAFSLLSFFLLMICLRVRVSLPESAAEREEEKTLTIEMRSYFPLAAGFATIIYSAPQDKFNGIQRSYHEVILPFRKYTSKEAVMSPYRGLYDIPVSFELRDFFGFFKAKRRLSKKKTPVLTVLPFVKLQNGDYSRNNTNYGDIEDGRNRGDDLSASDIREWRDGDRVRQIHWKLSARTQDIIVREYEGFPPPKTLVFLDLRRHDESGEAGAAIEDSLTGTAASICAESIENGYPVVLICRGTFRRDLAGNAEEDVGYIRRELAAAAFDGHYDLIPEIEKEIAMCSEGPEPPAIVRIITNDADHGLEKYVFILNDRGMNAGIISIGAANLRYEELKNQRASQAAVKDGLYED